MKKFLFIIALALATVPAAHADGLLGNILEGVFQKSDLSIADLAGEWTVDGSAVAFQSDNLLKKAGGMAAASAIEAKINPYLEQFGIEGGKLTVQTDGQFTIQGKSNLTLSGQISTDKNKSFKLEFKGLGGKVTLAKMTVYFQKTSTTMDVLFDAEGLRKLLSVLSTVTGSKLATGAVDILNSYDGLCVGLHTTKTGKVEGEKSSGIGSVLQGIFGGSSSQQTETQTQQTETQTQGSGIGSVLQGIFGGNSSQETEQTQTQTQTQTEESSSGGLIDLLRRLGGGTKK